MDNPMMPVEEKNKIVIITGMSGAGKTQALKAVEDAGWFCIDNLPPALFEKFIQGLGYGDIPRLAIAADIRSGVDSLPELEQVLFTLREQGVDFRLVFLEASDAILLRRYKENRRPHPLEKRGLNTAACIAKERDLLQGLRGNADIIIDTSKADSHQLRERLISSLCESEDAQISVSVMSFGFKYGLPSDCDLVMDVRFLPNPYYIPELKELTGLDREVSQYVLTQDSCKQFMSHYMRLLRFLLPYYQKEGKRNLTIGIGCTGGRHRSVAIAEEISKRLHKNGYSVSLSHRDASMWK